MSNLMMAHIAAHDLFLASCNNERRLTPQQFADSLQILLNCKFETDLVFCCHDAVQKKHLSLSIRKKLGWLSSEIIVKI